MLDINCKQNLIDSFNTYFNNSICKCCGGTYDYKTFNCRYCGDFNEKLKTSYENIDSLLSKLTKDDLDKKLYLYLYKASSINEDLKKEFAQFDVDIEVDKIINELQESSSYNKEDGKLIDFIFSDDLFLEKDKKLRDLILRNVILRKNTLSKEIIEKVVSHLVLSSTRKISKNSNFFISDLGEEISGSAFYYNICLDRKEMDSFYDNGDIQIFFTLFHEMSHIYRTYLESKGMVNSIYDLLALKERLLSKYSLDIYLNDNNYVKNLHEIEANVNSYYLAVNYLKSLGLEIDNEYALTLSSVVNNDLTNVADPFREIDGELVNINDLFKEFIEDRKDLLDKYPQLHYEFKEEDGKVVYKSKMELVDDYLLCDDNNLEELYLCLIDNAAKNEKMIEKNNSKEV